jgi:hypothetical protein
VGLTGLELLEKFNRRDLADCHAEVVAYNPVVGFGGEFVSATPVMPLHPATPRYSAPFLGDDWHWAPTIPDRIDARRRPVLEAALARAKVTAKIDEFFRPTDQLGAGNDEFAALREFHRFFARCRETLARRARPIPRISSNFGWGFPFLGHGGDAIGGRGFPPLTERVLFKKPGAAFLFVSGWHHACRR